MAKKSAVNISLLSQIASGQVTRLSQDEAGPLIAHSPPLIEANTADIDEAGKALVRLTDAGNAALPKSGADKAAAAGATVPQYAVISGFQFEPGAKKLRGRAGGGAVTLYPWATMEVGGSFFVGPTADHPNAVKRMTSAVSAANMKYSEEVGEEKPVERTKRGPGNKSVIGPDGKPEKETVMRRERKALRKFELREVKKGETIGNWVAPDDGALIGRVI